MGMIDTHHHLWRYNSIDYNWIDDSMKILRRDYLPGELEVEMKMAGVTGTIVVQARQTLEETQWLLEISDSLSFIKGVVGWVDLQSTDLEKQLDEFAGHPRMVGVRHVIHDEPDDNFLFRPAFLNGIEKLQKYDLIYELLLLPTHLSGAVELVSLFPDQKFVLDHISKPFIKSGILQPWKENIEELAGQSNVWCKISGMVTEADHQGWKYDDFVPYMNTVVHAFGTNRIMIGSDWPVCKLAAEYKDVISIPIKFFASLSQSQKQSIYYQNAIDFYQIIDCNGDIIR